MKANFRAEFECLLKETVALIGANIDNAFERNEAGDYTDLVTASMWIGFQLYAKTFDSDQINNGKGSYILGKRTNGGRFTISARPFIHRTRDLAIAEAEKLCEADSSTYVLFRCMGTTSPKK